MTAARRDVFQAEALGWLEAYPAAPGTAVITSLPDVSELPELDFAGWRSWFVAAAERVMRWTPEDSVAIFYQSDVRHRGAWVDKGHLVLSAAERADAKLVWHKIVCREAPGSVSSGRASYSHLICVAREIQRAFLGPACDVLPEAGSTTHANAIGVQACRAACEFLRSATATRLVVDPFCGHGTVLAVANAFGLDAVGIDVRARCCRAARRLSLDLLIA